jgi:hypothetical protein
MPTPYAQARRLRPTRRHAPRTVRHENHFSRTARVRAAGDGTREGPQVSRMTSTSVVWGAACLNHRVGVSSMNATMASIPMKSDSILDTSISCPLASRTRSPGRTSATRMVAHDSVMPSSCQPAARIDPPPATARSCPAGPDAEGVAVAYERRAGSDLGGVTGEGLADQARAKPSRVDLGEDAVQAESLAAAAGQAATAAVRARPASRAAACAPSFICAASSVN